MIYLSYETPFLFTHLLIGIGIPLLLFFGPFLCRSLFLSIFCPLLAQGLPLRFGFCQAIGAYRSYRCYTVFNNLIPRSLGSYNCLQAIIILLSDSGQAILHTLTVSSHLLIALFS
ncbi:hypothetical protein D9M68_818940 [compost metagenome]